MDAEALTAWEAFAREANWENLSTLDLERFSEFVRLSTAAAADRPDFIALLTAQVSDEAMVLAVVPRLDALYDLGVEFWQARAERS